MTYVLWTVLSILAYVAGLILITRATPRLLLRSYDEGWFIGIAALDIVGALLVFGAITLTYFFFSGAFAVKVLDFVLLLGVLFVGVRVALSSFRSQMRGTFRVSRIVAGTYGIFLGFAACYTLVSLFISH